MRRAATVRDDDRALAGSTLRAVERAVGSVLVAQSSASRCIGCRAPIQSLIVHRARIIDRLQMSGDVAGGEFASQITLDLLDPLHFFA